MAAKGRHARAKVKHGKPATRPTKPERRKARAPENRGGARVRRVDAALNRYEKACRTALARGQDLAALANLIGEAAVEKHSDGIIRDWCERQLLRDVIGLRAALAEYAPGSLNSRLESLRLLPDALMQWLETRFHIVPSGTAGEELEIPAARLRNYACAFDVPTDGTRLVRVCVVTPGWKRGNSILIPPCVRLKDQPETVLPDDPADEKGPSR